MKVWTQEEMKDMLNRHDSVVEAALLRLYDRQTQEEKSAESTIVHNGRGFGSYEAGFLTSCAKGLQKYGHLTPKQLVCVRKAMLKHIRQVTECANEWEQMRS